MAAKYGFSSFNNSLNNLDQGNTSQAIANLQQLIIAVRVKSIVLNDKHPRFKELGEWNGLGTIEFQDVNNPLDSPSYSTAIPLNPNSKNFPLVNEIVFLITLPDTNIGELTSASKSYYINPIALWNHPHHNAYPSNPSNPLPPQQKDTSYNWPSYIPFFLPWTTSDAARSDIEQINRKIVFLTETKQKLYGLSQYITNYTEFAI